MYSVETACHKQLHNCTTNNTTTPNTNIKPCSHHKQHNFEFYNLRKHKPLLYYLKGKAHNKAILIMSSSSLESITLDITIKKAEGLAGKDFSLLRKKTSDPFVNICVGDRIVKRTSIKYKTCEPEWNESFQITVDGDDRVSLELYDHDQYTENDPMGNVVIFANEQTERESYSEFTKWFDLETSESDQDVTGRIEVRLGIRQDEHCPDSIQVTDKPRSGAASAIGNTLTKGLDMLG